jgi:sugar lactone lactonase YvrE
MRSLFLGCGFFLLSCTNGPSSGPDDKKEEGRAPPTLGDDDDDVVGDDDDDDATTPPTIPLDDCPIPDGPRPWEYLAWVPPSEEFAFDDQGYLVNVDDGTDTIWRTPYGGPKELIGPYQAVEVAGTRIMLDGDLVVCNEWEGSLVRIGMDGSNEVLLGGLNSPNSVAIDDEGMVYVTSFDEVRRVDPETGDMNLLKTVTNSDLDGLTFSPDFQSLYFNHDDGGTIGVIELNADGEADDIYTINTIDGWNELDGMNVDECGNVYVLRTDGNIWRLLTDHTLELFMDLSGANPWTTSLNFGSGIGGWQRDHLYVMDRNGGMFDIDVGINGKWEPHLPSVP